MIHADSVKAWEAETESLKAEIEQLRKAVDADGFHRVLAAKDAEIERLTAVIKLGRLCDSRYCTFGNENEIERLKAQNDEAYRQRNHLVAALAHLFPSGIRATTIAEWEEGWNGCVYIDLPAGQISYHYHDSQASLFADLPPYTKPWDGHSKDVVHSRLAALEPKP